MRSVRPGAQTETVPAEKLRPGDVVAVCSGVEPTATVTAADYVGWKSGLNSVYIGLDGRPGPGRGFLDDGVEAPSSLFYMRPDDAAAARQRPTAMDDFYAEASPAKPDAR